MTVSADRIRNWARWVRVFDREPDGSCGSVERRWDSKRWYHDPEPPKPTPPDRADAWDIEIACRMLPIKHHSMLKLHYVERAGDADVIRLFREHLGVRIVPSDIGGILGMAHLLLAEAMELPAVVRKQRAQALIRKILADPDLTPQSVVIDSA